MKLLWMDACWRNTAIAIGVLCLIVIFVAIVAAVTVITVVVPTARIRIKRFILVNVFASLTNSILITGSVTDVAVVPIIRLVVDVPIAVILVATTPIAVTITPSAVLVLVAGPKAGERFSLRGHKITAASGRAFRVDSVSRDYGACSP
jgi:hypothetical protein